MFSLIRLSGAKNRLQKYIQPHIKNHRIWVDCTWGGGSTSINKKESPWEIGCDINPKVIRFNKEIQQEYPEISRWISTLDYSQDTFDWAHDWEQAPPVEFAVKTLIRNRMSFDGNMKQYTWSDRLRRGMPEFLSVWESMPERIMKFGKRIQNFHFFVADVERSIKLVSDVPDSFLFVDLPYKMGERTTKHLYEYDTLNNVHTRMLHAIRNIKGSGAVCHYEDSEYSTLLSNWNKKEILVKINKGSRKIKNNRTEILYWR